MVNAGDSIEVRTTKRQFVPAEFDLLDDWCPFLERKQKGTTLIYLQLQRGINRQDGHPDEGKTWFSVSRLMDKINASRPTVHKCLDVLREEHFITIENRRAEGKSNLYTVHEVPPFSYSQPRKKPIKETGEEKEKEVFAVGTDFMMEQYKEKARATLEELSQKADWNSKDLFLFFTQAYVLFFGVRSRDKINGKDMRLLKTMIEEYGWEVVRDVIKFSIENWERLEYMNGYPTIQAIFGFRETLIPEMKRGRLKAAARGQFSSRQGGKEVVGW